MSSSGSGNSRCDCTAAASEEDLRSDDGSENSANSSLQGKKPYQVTDGQAAGYTELDRKHSLSRMHLSYTPEYVLPIKGVREGTYSFTPLPNGEIGSENASKQESSRKHASPIEVILWAFDQMPSSEDGLTARHVVSFIKQHYSPEHEDDKTAGRTISTALRHAANFGLLKKVGQKYYLKNL